MEAVKRLVTNDQVDLDNLNYRNRLNFDNGHIVFLTILGIIDKAKQERFRMRLGDASDTEDGERTETPAEPDEIKDDLNRVEKLRGDLMAKMCDYDEKKAHVDSLKRKHDREISGLVSRHPHQPRYQHQGGHPGSGDAAAG